MKRKDQYQNNSVVFVSEAEKLAARKSYSDKLKAEWEEVKKNLPLEFQSYIYWEAYDRGHYAGEDEVNLIAINAANGIRGTIESYNKRIFAEITGLKA